MNTRRRTTTIPHRGPRVQDDSGGINRRRREFGDQLLALVAAYDDLSDVVMLGEISAAVVILIDRLERPQGQGPL
jgi:hypothetical protein